MKRFGLIVNNSYKLINANKYKTERFVQEFEKLDCMIDCIDTISLGLCIKDNKPYCNIDLSKYAFALFFDKDEQACRLLENFLPVFNSSFSLINCNDKFKTYLVLANNNISMPLTIPSPICYDSNYSKESFKKFLDYVESNLGYPLICKCCYGSLGLQVFLINSRDELDKKYEELIFVPHLYQKYISSSKGKDYRMYVVDNKVVACMLRNNPNDFRSNISLGGKGFNITPNKEYIDLACKCSSLLKLDYGGIDLLIGEDNKPVVAEVNSNAFVSEIENVTKINVTSLIAKHILNKLK